MNMLYMRKNERGNKMKYYGKELIIDLHNCDTRLFTREIFEQFLKELCGLIKMEREDLHFWDYEGDHKAYKEAPPHLKGISLVQFIKTSNITIHSLDELRKLFLNVFSCKPFDAQTVVEFAEIFFVGECVSYTEVTRL